MSYMHCQYHDVIHNSLHLRPPRIPCRHKDLRLKAASDEHDCTICGTVALLKHPKKHIQISHAAAGRDDCRNIGWLGNVLGVNIKTVNRHLTIMRTMIINTCMNAM